MILFSLAIQLNGQDQAKRLEHFNIEESLAIQGYDPVAYFEIGEAKKGKKDISLTYQGVIYRFASVQNKNLFEQNPQQYEPKYGGWCAYAMGSDGSKVRVDPKTFKIKDGELYLFYNFYFNNTLKDWNKDENNLKRSAEENWSRVVGKN